MTKFQPDCVILCPDSIPAAAAHPGDRHYRHFRQVKRGHRHHHSIITCLHAYIHTLSFGARRGGRHGDQGYHNHAPVRWDEVSIHYGRRLYWAWGHRKNIFCQKIFVTTSVFKLQKWFLVLTSKWGQKPEIQIWYIQCVDGSRTGKAK